MSRIAFIGYLNYVKDAQAFYWLNPSRKFTQESRTTLIGCAESVPARKYKITCNPAKGVLLSSATQESSSRPFWLNLHNPFSRIKHFESFKLLPDEIKPKSLKLSSSFYLTLSKFLDSTQPYSIRQKQTKHGDHCPVTLITATSATTTQETSTAVSNLANNLFFSKNPSMTSRLYEIVENFDSLVGDNPLQDSTLTLNLFSQLLREVRIRKQRQAIQAHQETIARQQQLRPQTPPPKYSNAKSKKVSQPTTN